MRWSISVPCINTSSVPSPRSASPALSAITGATIGELPGARGRRFVSSSITGFGAMYLHLLGRGVETAVMMVNSNPQGRVGIDTGGTFTDCVSIDDATNRIEVVKLPSRPADPQKAVIAAFEGSREKFGHDGAGHFGTLIHGTTIGTNAVITGDYARTGMITNRGFRDVLEIGTQQR